MNVQERYMKQALKLAKKAALLDEVPIGCVVEYQGKVIGRGYNRRTTDKNVLAHAEITAIRKACKKMGDWRLEDCTMYVTLEPCQMCAGAIVLSRIPELFIGTMNPKAGACGSLYNIVFDSRLNHRVQVTTGVMEDTCRQMMQEFFRRLKATREDK